jgi:hypothetical protein
MNDWVLGVGAFGFAWILGIFIFVFLYVGDLQSPPTSGNLDLDGLIDKTLEMRKRTDTHRQGLGELGGPLRSALVGGEPEDAVVVEEMDPTPERVVADLEGGAHRPSSLSGP